MNNREIVYVLRMRNESRAAIRQLADDIRGLTRSLGSLGVPLAVPGTLPGGGSGGGGGRGGSGGGGINIPGLPNLPGTNVQVQQITATMTALQSSLTGSISGFATLALRMTGFGIAGYTVGQTFNAMVQAADAANASIGRLTAALGDRSLAVDTYDAIAASAAKIGANINDSVSAFLRFNMAAQGIGRSRDDALAFTETIQKLAVVSGTTGQEASATFIQLGQALASGRLQGDELRSVLEQMPQLAMLIAKEMGTGMAEIRKLGEEGKLTPDIIFNAVQKAAKGVDAQFASMPLTVERASGQMTAGFNALARRLDDITGTTQKLAEWMQKLGIAGKAAADAMAPETAQQRLDKFRLANPVAQQQRVEQSSDRELEAFKQRFPNTTPSSPMNPTGDEAIYQARLQQEEKLKAARAARSAVELKAEADRRAEIAKTDAALEADATYENALLDNIKTFADLVGQARAAEEALARTRMAGKEVLEALGLANDDNAKRVKTLVDAVKAGDNAFKQYGIGAKQAGIFLEELRAKANPALQVIRELNQQLLQLQADAGGELSGAIASAMAKAGNSLRLPNGMVDEDLAGNIADEVKKVQAQKASNENDKAERDNARELALFRARGNARERERLARQFATEDAQKVSDDPNAWKRAGDAAAAREHLANMQAEAGKYQSLAEVIKEVNERLTTAKIAYESEAQGQQLSTAQTTARTEALKTAKDGTAAYQAAYSKLLPLMEQEQNYLVRRDLLAGSRRLRDETTGLEEETSALRDNNDAKARGIALEEARIRQQLRAAGRDPNAAPAAVRTQAEDTQTRNQSTFNRDFAQTITTRRQEMTAEIALVGLHGDALEKARFVMEQQNDAQRKNVEFTKEARAEAEGLYDTLAKQRDALRGDAFAGLKSGLDRFADDAKNVFAQVEDMAVRMGTSMTDAIVEFAMTGKANFQDFALSVIRDMLRIAAQQAIVKPLFQIASSVIGGATGTGGIFSGIGKLFGVAHTGGVAGYDIPGSRTLEVAPRFHVGGVVDRRGQGPQAAYREAVGAFARASRFHSGGMPSGRQSAFQTGRLRHDEVPIIAQRGEVIMPTVQKAGSRRVRAITGDGEIAVPVIRLADGIMGIDIRAVAAQVQAAQAQTQQASPAVQPVASASPIVVQPSGRVAVDFKTVAAQAQAAQGAVSASSPPLTRQITVEAPRRLQAASSRLSAQQPPDRASTQVAAGLQGAPGAPGTQSAPSVLRVLSTAAKGLQVVAQSVQGRPGAAGAAGLAGVVGRDGAVASNTSVVRSVYSSIVRDVARVQSSDRRSTDRRDTSSDNRMSVDRERISAVHDTNRAYDRSSDREVYSRVLTADGAVGRETREQRLATVDTFANAPRFRSGGVSSPTGERPLMARTGDALLPAARLPGAGQYDNGQSAAFAPVINIEINRTNGQGSGGSASGGEDDRHLAESVSRMVRDALKAQMAAFITEQKRSGGMLNPVASL